MTITFTTKQLKNELKNVSKDWTEKELQERIEFLGNREKEETNTTLKETLTSLYLAFEKIKDEKFPKKEETKKEKTEKFETHAKKQKTVIGDSEKSKTVSFEEHFAILQEMEEKGILATLETAKDAALLSLRRYLKSFDSQILELATNPDMIEYCKKLEHQKELAKGLIEKIQPSKKKESIAKIDTLTLDYSDMYKILKTDEKEFAEICMSLELMQTNFELNAGCIPFILLSILQGKEKDVLFQDGKTSFNSKSVIYRTEKIFYNVHFVELLKKHFKEDVWKWIKNEGDFYDIADYTLSNYVETANETNPENVETANETNPENVETANETNPENVETEKELVTA